MNTEMTSKLIADSSLPLYHKKGQMAGPVGAIIMMIVGVGVAVLIMIFVGVLAGKAYSLNEKDINNITNGSIRDSINNGIISGFEALEQTGNYLPLIVLAVVISLVMSLILGFLVFGGAGSGGSRGGTAL